jgi:DNA-binding PadR family transcriptional regulator
MSSTHAFDDGWAAKFGRAQENQAGGRRRRGRFRDARRADLPFGAFADDDTEHHRHGHGRPGGRQFGPQLFGGPFGGGPFGGGPFGFGGPFGPFGPGRGRRGGRARRGDVRAAALVLLAEQPRNGYQIIQELATRSDGAWRASPGSVYPALQQLEDEGLIRATSDDGQRLWELTDAGRSYVDENRERLGAPWEAFGVAMPNSIRDLAEIGLQVGSAVHQVVRAGNDAQIA